MKLIFENLEIDLHKEIKKQTYREIIRTIETLDKNKFDNNTMDAIVSNLQFTLRYELNE